MAFQAITTAVRDRQPVVCYMAFGAGEEPVSRLHSDIWLTAFRASEGYRSPSAF
jgi:hypothetical protein